MLENLRGIRVLIVEDEPLVAILIEDTLSDFGCVTVATVSSASVALSKAAQLDFDVAVLDVNLNGEKSFRVAEVLTGRQIPFIFSTGYGAPDIPAAFHRAPVLKKPFQERDLEQALRAALGR